MEQLLCFNADNFVPGVSRELLRNIYPIYYFGSFALTLVVIIAIWLAAGRPRPLIIIWGIFAAAAATLFAAQPVICSALPLPYPFNNFEIIFAIFLVPMILFLGIGSTRLFVANPRAQTALMLITLFTTWQFGTIGFG